MTNYEAPKTYTIEGQKGIPATDPRHPLYRDATALKDGEVDRFADRHARDSRICPACGLISKHRISGCPLSHIDFSA